MTDESTHKLGEGSEQPTSITVRLRWGDDSHLETIFANHMFFNADGPDVYLVFGELVPPIRLMANKEPIDEVEIQPVVRLAIPRESMVQIIRLLNKQLSNLTGNSEESDQSE